MHPFGPLAFALALAPVLGGARVLAAAPDAAAGAPSPAGTTPTPATPPTGAGAAIPPGAPPNPPTGASEITPAPVPPAASPPVAPQTVAPAPTAPTASASPSGAAPLQADELPNAGYVPGYRAYQGLSLGPSAPRVGALPGGLTAGFGAPMPLTQWSFKWSGFLNDSFQSSIGRRMTTGPDQTSTVFHIPPMTVDEYASFLGTGTMPGQWIALNMSYGNPIVSANLALNTWNPTEPTTYYQIGSQNFVNDAYLRFDIPAMGELKTRAMVGYFYTTYGAIGQYGLGIYTNPLVALVRGVGENVAGEYRLTPTVRLLLEEGFMGNRNGKIPDGTIASAGNGSTNPGLPAAWVAHLHAGLVREGTTTFKAQLHLLTNWAQDDRVQCQNASTLAPAGTPCFDNPTTHEINESYVPNAHLTVVGFDASANHTTYGYLGLAGSYVTGKSAYPLRGMATFGGEGQPLTDRWWGTQAGGTGSLYAAGINYTASLGRILSAPLPFRSDGPDLIVNAGAVLGYTTDDAQTVGGATTPGALPSSLDPFNHRLRYKLGVDALYTYWSWMGFGVRVDRVTPSSKDAAQTFYVLAPRLVFKTNWMTRETITLLYGKWFYGSNTHPDASSIVAPDGRLDDQLIALNVNMWW
jgi:hypothetical protein